MAIYSIRVSCNDVTPSEIVTEYISALNFSTAMRLGLAHFEDRELELFHCEEIDTKTLQLRLMTAVLSDSESNGDKSSEVLEIGSALMAEINNLKSQLTAMQKLMEDDSDCALNDADEDWKVTKCGAQFNHIYELGYADGTNGLNVRHTINPELRHIYDHGFVEGQKDARSKWY